MRIVSADFLLIECDEVSGEEEGAHIGVCECTARILSCTTIQSLSRVAICPTASKARSANKVQYCRESNKYCELLSGGTGISSVRFGEVK